MTSTQPHSSECSFTAKPYYPVPVAFSQKAGFVDPSQHLIEAWLALDVKGNAGFNFKGTLLDALTYASRKHQQKGSSSHYGPFVLRPQANSSDPEFWGMTLFPFSSRSIEMGNVVVLPQGRFHENFHEASFLWFEFDGLTAQAEEDLFEHLLSKKLAFVAHTSKSHNPHEEFGHKWHIFVPLQRSVRYPEYLATMQKLTSELPASCVVDPMSERFTQGAAIPRVLAENAQWAEFLSQPGVLLAPEKAEIEEVMFTKHLADVAFEKGLIAEVSDEDWKSWMLGYSGKTDNNRIFRNLIQAILRLEDFQTHAQLAEKAMFSIACGAASFAREKQQHLNFDKRLWEPVLQHAANHFIRPSEKGMSILYKKLKTSFENAWKTKTKKSTSTKNRDPLMRITPVNAAFSIQFVTQFFQFHPNPITARALWEEYVAWSKANNITYRPIVGFGKALKDFMATGNATFEKYTVKGQSKYRLKRAA